MKMSKASLPDRTPDPSQFRAHLYAIVLLVCFGGVALYHELEQTSLARRAIFHDGARQAASARANTAVLECRRYEKDFFLNRNDVGRREAYLQKWNDQWDALSSAAFEVSSLLSDSDPRRKILEPENLNSYRRHFYQVVEMVNKGEITLAEDANLAMSSFKTEARAISHATDELASESALNALEAGGALVSRLSNNVVIVCLLTTVPSILIVVGFRRQHQNLSQYARELGRREEGERLARLEAERANRGMIRALENRKIAERELRVSKDKFEWAARTDQLTSLPNRSLFLDRLRHSVERARLDSSRRVFAMFIDFDRFKLINDTLGHDMGDALLVEISKRLQTTLKSPLSIESDLPGNCVGRIGGDEFVILIDDVHVSDSASEIAESLMKVLSRPYLLGDHQIHSAASIGIVVDAQAYESVDDIVRDADTAMYEAKHSGRGTYVVFDEAMRERVIRKARLEEGLRCAISNDQLSLVYQPIVNLTSGTLECMEVLLRWHHPELGVVGPDEFIPIAEESNLIQQLGEWVLNQGCQQFSKWIGSLGKNSPPMLSVNLSRKQFNTPNLQEMIRETTERYGVDPSRVQLEITEDAFDSNENEAIKTMKAIKKLGVKLAIDDFGKGASSFSSLREFPVDVLKIDRSLIRGVDACKETAALVHSIATLVHNIGITMVAEGIETAGELVAVQELGCQHGQGYFFSKPMVSEKAESYLRYRHDENHSVIGAKIFQRRWEEELAMYESFEGDTGQDAS